MSDQTFKIEKHERHRNGVSGYPFHVGLITDEDGTTKVFVHFETTEAEDKVYGGQSPRTAILDVDLLAKGVIEFGANSHRGDHYSHQIEEQIAHEDSESDKNLKASDPAIYAIFKGGYAEEREERKAVLDEYYASPPKVLDLNREGA
jgi:hypothetical protein